MDICNDFVFICEYYSVWNEVRSFNIKLMSLEICIIDDNVGNLFNYGDGI